MLLDDAKISYVLAVMDADETACDWSQPLRKVVESIALFKMEHVILPPGKSDNEICFVLTADTLSQDAHGTISGKPKDRDDAILKLKAARDGIVTGTAFCLEKKVWRNGKWQIDRKNLGYAQAEYEFLVPNDKIDVYLGHTNTLGSQAIAVESYGAQFLKSVRGSYTAIVGLPLYELRVALEEMNFFNQPL
jgi:septum formation protein